MLSGSGKERGACFRDLLHWLCVPRPQGKGWMGLSAVTAALASPGGTGGKASLSQESCVPQLRGDLGHSRENTTTGFSPPRRVAADKTCVGVMLKHGEFTGFKKRSSEHLADYILTEEVAEYPKLELLYRQRDFTQLEARTVTVWLRDPLLLSLGITVLEPQRGIEQNWGSTTPYPLLLWLREVSAVQSVTQEKGLSFEILSFK